MDSRLLDVTQVLREYVSKLESAPTAVTRSDYSDSSLEKWLKGTLAAQVPSSYFSGVSFADDQDTRWLLVRQLLGICLELNEALLSIAADEEAREIPGQELSARRLEEPIAPRDLLSLRDLACLYSAAELLIQWGLLPCLEPGVGGGEPETRFLPKAVRIHPRVLHWGYKITRERGIEVRVASNQLYLVVMGLQKVLQLQHVKAILLKRYLPDLLGGLLQVAYGYDGKTDLRERARHNVRKTIDSLGPWLCTRALRQLLVTGQEHCPRWLQRSAGHYLTCLLLAPGGLEATLHIFLENQMGNDPLSNEFWQATTKVGQLIATVPRNFSCSEYVCQLAPQLHALMQGTGSSSSAPKSPEMCICLITEIAAVMPDETVEHVIVPMMQPLCLAARNLGNLEQNGVSQSVEYSEGEVDCAIDALCGLLFTLEPPPSLVQLLIKSRMLIASLRLFSFCRRSKSHHLQPSRRLVLMLLDRGDPGLVAQEVVEAIHLSTVLELRASGFDFAAGPSGGVILRISGRNGANIQGMGLFDEVRHLAEAVVELLGEVREESSVPGAVFEGLLRYGSGHEPSVPPRMGAMLAMATMAQNLGMRLFTSGLQMLKCLRAVLERVAEAQDVDDEESSPLDLSLCEVVLGLLTVLLEMGAEQRSTVEESELRKMGPSLEALSHCQNPVVADMATTLRASILCRSLGVKERQEEKRRSERVLGSRVSLETGKESTEVMRAALKDVQEDLGSALPPLRARGVVTLTRLVRSASSNAVESAVADEFMGTYISMLEDEESYVYLAAVQGLSTMADCLPSHCIPVLVAKLCDLSSSMTWEIRLKLGEAVMFAARRCGEVMPKYSHYFVNAFILSARPSASNFGVDGLLDDEEELQCFRASCLSNLAEVCELLHWSLKSHAADISDLALGVLNLERRVGGCSSRSEEARVRARRGAAFLLCGILRGCGDDLFLIMPTQLKPIFRGLQLASSTDSDDVTRHHALQGLSLLNSFVRTQFRDAGGV